MRTIKFEEDKITMKPIEGENGLKEVWAPYRPTEEVETIQFIVHNRRYYYLITVK
jgi:hypothetical protein